eukprot:scaffold412547_cov47-Prasinocladus_malaysianus.AAC.2
MLPGSYARAAGCPGPMMGLSERQLKHRAPSPPVLWQAQRLSRVLQVAVEHSHHRMGCLLVRSV